ncbi:MAG: rRNA pseudouridine synthase [Mycoplasmataceae bacterium]|nr:rRNA pseudouridine synthase [Mycoplasmataceae bacterium]
MERIQKILSQAGVASRRKAEELIIAGRVVVNGKAATLGDKADFTDEIWVDGKQIFGKEEHVYYLLNKPPKSISSVTDPQGRRTVTDLIADKRKLFPVGRLDWETTGTLLITNDGALSNRLIHPKYEVIRVYRARLSRTLENKEVDFLNSKDVMLNHKKSLQEVTRVDRKTYVVALKQGSYHHVKKLFELVDAEVIKLTRIEFAGITHVGELSLGQYRELKPQEIRHLKELTKDYKGD